MTKPIRHSYVTSPYEIIIDTREQAPYAFRGFRTDAADGNRDLVVRTVAAALEAGDYSLVGHEPGETEFSKVYGEHAHPAITIERKSKADCFATFISDRDRGMAQLEKLANLCDFPNVVVECSLDDLACGPDNAHPDKAQRIGKSMYRSVIAWRFRYPTIHWWFCEGRAASEKCALRILERFWKEQHE